MEAIVAPVQLDAAQSNFAARSCYDAGDAAHSSYDAPGRPETAWWQCWYIRRDGDDVKI